MLAVHVSATVQETGAHLAMINQACEFCTRESERSLAFAPLLDFWCVMASCRSHLRRRVKLRKVLILAQTIKAPVSEGFFPADAGDYLCVR